MRTEIDEIHNFKTISPQGDGNAVNGPRLKSRACGFQNHIPARGRKPLREECNILFCIANISKPYPRKGTETCRLSGVVSARIWRNFKTISPQGDGNLSESRMFSSSGEQDFKTISPQGDGNVFVFLSLQYQPLYFKTISPQGDGNKMEPPASPARAGEVAHAVCRRGRHGRKL